MVHPQPLPTNHNTEANIAVFDGDAVVNGGYRYTTNAPLSSRMANGRMSDLTHALADFHGQSVLDIGCGDGAYTIELFDRGQPALLHALDPAPGAIDVAAAKAGARPIRFRVGSAYELPYSDDSFDWACFRGVLHHLDRPADALGEALRVARRLLVIEPSGYNPVLKLLERFSPYHVAHDEQSFMAATLRNWVRRHGGTVSRATFGGLVPCFCPDWMARLTKAVEPLVEHTPLVRAVCCAVYVFVAERGSPPLASDPRQEKAA
jgi:SAM-dependent methyltransferase